MVVAKTAKHSIKRSHQLTNLLVVSVVVVTVVVGVIATREIECQIAFQCGTR